MAIKKVSAKDIEVNVMATNEYTLSVVTTLPASVEYGATVTAPATAYPISFTPAYGVSALTVNSFSASSNNSSLSYAISAPQAFPVTLTTDGLTANRFEYNVQITNNSPDANTNNSVIFSLSSVGIGLSAGVTGSMHSGASLSSPATVQALGAPASGITGFTATPYADYMNLSWNNPPDLSGVKILRSPVTVTKVNSGVCAIINVGAVASYNDTVGKGVSAFYYGAVSFDADGNQSSSLQVTSASGIRTQSIPSCTTMPELNVLDPLSPIGETRFARICRLRSQGYN